MFAPRKDNSKNAKKFKSYCHNCEKTGHRSNECQKSKKTAQVNVVKLDTISKEVQEISLTMIVSECNTIGNPRDWWVDIGATRHICANKTMFSNYHELRGEQLFMRNSASSRLKSLVQSH